MKFEWDKTKPATNLGKHGVSFDEAATVFLDGLAARRHSRLQCKARHSCGKETL